MTTIATNNLVSHEDQIAYENSVKLSNKIGKKITKLEKFINDNITTEKNTFKENDAKIKEVKKSSNRFHKIIGVIAKVALVAAIVGAVAAVVLLALAVPAATVTLVAAGFSIISAAGGGYFTLTSVKDKRSEVSIKKLEAPKQKLLKKIAKLKGMIELNKNDGKKAQEDKLNAAIVKVGLKYGATFAELKK